MLQEVETPLCGSKKIDDYSRLWMENFDVQNAQKYHAKFGRPTKRYKHDVQLAVVKKWVRPGICLDAPIGSGRVADSLQDRRDVKVVGIDLSPAFLQHCRGNLDIPLVLGDIHTLPFATSSVDTIVCLQTLFGLPRYRDIIDEFMRILKKEGRLILNLPNAAYTNSRIFRVFRKNYPYSTPSNYNELPDIFSGHGTIVDYYKHDWADGIASLHPVLNKVIQRMLVWRSIQSWLIHLELNHKGLLPQWISAQHLLVVERS
ncbi:MAG: class I SAM-dependent methyltransferase [Chloroflexaceae bacterium]|nr:class I SAM-dependent methyltransferase [Chloroflexaceae bacterium]